MHDKDSKENGSKKNENEYEVVFPEHINRDDVEYNFNGSNNGKRKNKRKVCYLNEQKRNRFLINAVCVLLILTVVLGATLVHICQKDSNFLSFFTNKKEPENAEQLSKMEFEQAPEEEGAIPAEKLFENVKDTVVGIVVYDDSTGVLSDFAGQGSGIVAGKEGIIVTNAHVVGDYLRNKIVVVIRDDEKLEEIPAKVVGVDRRTDLSVIKVEKNNMKVAKFADSSKVKPGAVAYALGYPVSLDFYSSITKGIVSAVNRSISKSEVKYIQTDAAINPGNSGGALMDSHGNVIGMNTLKVNLAGVEGMGLAIPSETIQSVCKSLVSSGYVKGRVRLGFTGKVVSPYQAQVNNLVVGVLVIKIEDSSNLASAGVQVGDVIFKVDGVEITSFDSVSSTLSGKKPGDEVLLTYYRPSPRFSGQSSGKTFEASVRVIEDKGEQNAAFLK
ncbi:MAG: trypsin-like peptidase domain-containing protein [Oscillospiraceae bacterium]|jgi:serine protease Do|nr:trypsin-like peptidase domain-containing protein [Oscillospiraceae bacterium]